jgi:aminoglycoside/choline kinase family phosphotransferase/dTDP-glucose pyrophosphorylase
MKALILAAGFGTRLLPHTRVRHKALFTIANEPLIHRLIRQLIEAGCDTIMVNTHHLHQQLAASFASRSYPVPVHLRHEPKILGTGGAIRNMADLLDHAPFLVVNADIVTDVDFKALYDVHRAHPHPVTLLMHDRPEFNSVMVDARHLVRSFGTKEGPPAGECREMAFTGIQVLDRSVCEEIPAGEVHSIDIYRRLIARGHTIKAWVPQRFYWQDIGTPERYRRAAFEEMAPQAFRLAFDNTPSMDALACEKLAGDGSDRKWYRLSAAGNALVLSDHGITTGSVGEVHSFVEIGAHLFRKGIPVPRIHLDDRLSGLVFLEDLGSTLLHDWLRKGGKEDAVHRIYALVIDELVRMSFLGADGFSPSLCYQSASYDRELVLEKECRYFVDAFLNGYLRMEVDFEALLPEFSGIAYRALQNGVTGFLHRDLQSRNIMLVKERPFFIDFQGGRRGPVQYDLASLLADPYAGLASHSQERLLGHAIKAVRRFRIIEEKSFLEGYKACRLSRTLQVLGAFSHLFQVKEKPFFEGFIPAALESLLVQLEGHKGRYPILSRTACRAAVLFKARRHREP